MTNNINMSDYQKLIFVNNINENDFQNNESTNSIKQLSKEYPFAVFFTTLNNDIHNIWHDGTRLTRFIGVDPERCNIKVNSHTLKLKFDYDTGLLGITDVNKLANITVTSVKFTTLNGNEGTGNLINAIDNKFIITVKFNFDNSRNELSEDANALKIAPDIRIESYDGREEYYFSSVGSPRRVNSGSTDESSLYPTWVEYEYTYLINYDTLINWNDNQTDSRQRYKITSLYDDSQYIDLYLQLCLNPISYTMYYGNTVISNNDTLSLQNNTLYNFAIDIKPNTSNLLHSYPEHYDNRNLWLTIFSGNTSIANINGASQSLKKTVNGSRVEFDITTGSPLSNSSADSQISLSLSYKLPGSGESVYSGLTKSFTIKLIGESNACYYYAGFTDPRETSFNGLIDFKNINYTGNILWDWINHSDEAAGNNDKYFYIAIPYEYRNNILPCWDGYIMSGNTKLYVEATNRFEKLTCPETNNEKWPSNYNGTGIGGKNLDMIIYKSLFEFKGLFYGKIQVQ